MSTNGSNPRLDRIEKLIEQGERANKEAHARHDREMVEIRAIARKTRDDMRRWGALGVMESRRHRKKINDLDAKSAKYQAQSEKYRAHTDEKLAEIADKLDGLIGYVDGLRKPGPIG